MIEILCVANSVLRRSKELGFLGDTSRLKRGSRRFLEIPQELMELCRCGGRTPGRVMGGEGSRVWELRNILLGNFRISCSHKRVAMVWALAGAQWEVGTEKLLGREFREGIQDIGRGSLTECGQLEIYSEDLGRELPIPAPFPALLKQPRSCFSCPCSLEDLSLELL